MRKLVAVSTALPTAVVAVSLALVASLGAFAPLAPVQVANATTQPKVVIIVGAVHGSTDRYRDNANKDYAEAIKYTSNVVRVYSPNATWSAVKSAVKGASIVIYRGHGNGWPSPYTYDPSYTTKDGFGLNSAAGQGDYNNKYYGEPYIDDLEFAPNAVVLLHGLCYASGNSEPGHAEPSLSVAKQRADNYASAFLKAGAAAVIAGGKEMAAYYLRGLFTTRQTLDQLWRAAPYANDNTFNFPSVRRPGKTIQMDPENPTSAFYRAISGSLGTKTQDVTGAAYAATDTHPSTFVVPGAAAVNVDAAGIWPTTALSPASAPAQFARDTRVRVLAQALDPAGSKIFKVSTLDGTTTGYTRPSNLVPRDSVGPAAWTINTGGSTFSPNGDGSRDTFAIDGRLSESASWRVQFKSGSTVLAQTTGSSASFTATWNGADTSDGAHTWTLEAWDGWGNAKLVKSGSIVVDTAAPTASALTGSASTFTPNGDGVGDTVKLSAASSEAGQIAVAIRTSSGTIVRQLAAGVASGTGAVVWDGRNSSGSYVPDGAYRVDVTAVDGAGNASAVVSRNVSVYGALKSVVRSRSLFYPHDGDTLAPSTKLSFTLLRPATVTWDITRPDGTVVFTRYAKRQLAAGTYSFTWEGQVNGETLPMGKYLSRVDATNGAQRAVQRAGLEMNAFGITVSDTTPKRGQTITVTARTAEGLSTTPRVRIQQPGISSFTVTMSRVSSGEFRASIKFKASDTGTVQVRVAAYDTNDRFQYTYVKLPLS